jgi:hypothetical protein
MAKSTAGLRTVIHEHVYRRPSFFYLRSSEAAKRFGILTGPYLELAEDLFHLLVVREAQERLARQCPDRVRVHERRPLVQQRQEHLLVRKGR